MKIDARLQGLDDAFERAGRLEALGYDTAWASEVDQDPFLPLTLATQATGRIGVGSAIGVAFARSPMTLAYTAHALQRHSEGRFLLGLGSQVRAHIERRFSMPWAGRPVSQMREYVGALQTIWASWRTGERLDFEGEYYQHTLMPPEMVPPAHEHGSPKVMLAGVGDGMTRLAGEVADGFFCHSFTSTRWISERTLPALRTGRAKAGGTLSDFEIAASPPILTGTPEEIETAIPEVRRRIAFYASTPAYRDVLGLHGWEAAGVELGALAKASRWDRMPAVITDEMLHTFALIASPADLPAEITKRFSGLVTRLSFTPPPSFTEEEAAELVARLRAIC